MNHLDAISITNFRSCIDTHVEFSQSLSALIGVNGSGKTNTLMAIVMLSRSLQTRGRLTPIDLDGEDHKAHTTLVANINLDGVAINLKAELLFQTEEALETLSDARLSYKTPKAKTWNRIEGMIFEYARYNLSHNFGTKSNYANNFAEYIKRTRDVKNVDVKLAIANYLSSVSYYSATQFANPAKSPVSLELEDDRLVSRSVRSINHEVFLKNLYETYKSPKQFGRFMSIVGPSGLKLVEDIHFDQYSLPNNSYKVLVGGTIKNIEKSKQIIIPNVRVDGQQLSFSQLSEGTFKTLALIFYIMNDQNDLLIIEEPEVCVHHGLLASIIELIKIQSKFKQIIISTHSDYVLDKLKPENVLLVRKDGDKGTLVDPLSGVMYKDDYAYLKEYLEHSGNLGEYWRESGFEE